MPKNHLKPQKAPTTWAIKRKNVKYITRPYPGAHKIDLSMPLNFIFKTFLKIANTNKEVTKILHDHEILINGRRVKDYKYSMGLLDVLSIPKTKENYLMLINENNKLYIVSIDKKDADQKISKITGKKVVKKGTIQLKTLDGKTILVKKGDYKTQDSVVLGLPKLDIKSTIKLEKGTSILLFRGKYAGTIATVSDIQGLILKFKKDSKEFETRKKYAIAIGKDKPLIKIK